MDKSAGRHGIGERGVPGSGTFAAGLLLAGLSGAAGVALSALAAHLPSGQTIETPARFLLAHAPAFVGLAAICRVWNSFLLPLSLALIASGLALFCGDLLWRAAQGGGLFPMAAPTGGSLIILGWLAVALAGLAAFLRRG